MNTYSDIYLHIIFSVKYRDAMIGKYWLPELHAYIASIFNANGHKTIIVGGVEDHVHALVRYNISQTIPDMVKDVKKNASLWINSSHKTLCKFAWQKGYGVFSYSLGQVESVKKYILQQEKHHQAANFSHIDEFRTILEKRQVAYNNDYLPHEPE